MRHSAIRILTTTRTVWIASGLSLAIGLFFVFVWAPHPWGWRGIDQYDQLARALARGESFGTTDVPWGYAYYVGALYALFGPHAWVPVALQAVLNATVPLMLYRLVRPSTSEPVAVLSALLVGLFSFNTVYASTQSSDSICTVLFVASLLAFDTGRRTQRMRWFVLAGVLSGLVPQFRPNMLLFPPVLSAAYLVLLPRSRRRVTEALTYLIVVALPLVPWVVRTYRLTGLIVPTSTHGPVQLWYGTLQVGPYLESRAYNPRSFFEPPPFDYTSLIDSTIIVTAQPRTCPFWDDATTRIVYWTDRERTRQTIPGIAAGSAFEFHLPPQPDATVVYYYLEATGTQGGQLVIDVTPLGGQTTPAVVFVSSDHLGDLDRHDDFTDVFDVVRALQQSGSGGEADDAVRRLVEGLLQPIHRDGHAVTSLIRDGDRVMLTLSDGSTFSVPTTPIARVTDVEASGGAAATLLYARSRTRDGSAGMPSEADVDPCRLFDDIRVNDPFYRREPHQMRRYTALAWDNITRDPGAFAAASLYRMVRLFIVRGTDDRWTAHQFSLSDLVYAAGTAVSAGLFALMGAGIVMAWRRRSPLLVLALPIIYVPLTICFVLTNMRYTITVQPFMFVFVAVAVAAWTRLDGPANGSSRDELS